MHQVIHRVRAITKSGQCFLMRIIPKFCPGSGSHGATFATEKRGGAGGRVSHSLPVTARCSLLVPVCPGVVPLPGRLKPAPDKAVPVVPVVPVKIRGLGCPSAGAVRGGFGLFCAAKNRQNKKTYGPAGCWYALYSGGACKYLIELTPTARRNQRQTPAQIRSQIIYRLRGDLSIDC